MTKTIIDLGHKTKGETKRTYRLMLEASTFDYFMDMLLVDYHSYVFWNFGIIIK